MCAGALVLARVARLVYGADDPKAGAVGSLWDVVRDRRLNHRPEVVGGVLAEECARAAPGLFPEPARGSGNLCGGGVSERPKEHASKACEGASPPWVQIPPPPPAVVATFPQVRGLRGVAELLPGSPRQVRAQD